MRKPQRNRTNQTDKTKKKGPSPIPAKDQNAFPMRINKFLAMKGYSTRRGADELIASKSVTINGRFAVLGDKVEASDKVEVQSSGKRAENYVYYAYHKPVGISTGETRKGVDILQSIQIDGVFPVGNLDKKDSGLVILTNDRRITSRLDNPEHAHVRRYVVHTRQPLRANFKDKMEAGISLDGGPLINPRVIIQSPTSCVITLTETANPIRQMLALFQAEADTIVRTDILNINIGKLAPNGHRLISGEELSVFLRALGL